MAQIAAGLIRALAPSLRQYAPYVVMPVAIPRDRLDVALLNQRAHALFEALSDDQSRVFSIVRYFVSSGRDPAGSRPSGSMERS